MSNPASPHGLAGSYPERYGDSQNPQRFPQQSVDAKEKESVKQLQGLIDKVAPHLGLSFIRSSEWWWEHQHLREAHVSLTNQAAAFMKSVLTSPQMLKHLLFKGLIDIILIFSNTKAEDPSVIKSLLKKANEKAALIWKDKTTSFETRVEDCRKLVDPVLRINDPIVEGGKVEGVPAEIVDRLNKIFKKHYVEPNNKVLLIGQTTEEAYEVQDRYGRSVANYLGTLENGKNLESRAITCLSKVYGRNSMPLLTVASVWGLWELCQSSFYRRVTFLVSLLCLAMPATLLILSQALQVDSAVRAVT